MIYRKLQTKFNFELRSLPNGSFQMGAKNNDKQAFDNEKPNRKINIERPFEIGVYPVTQGLYFEITGDKPSSSRYIEHHPVDNVSWYDAIMFCNFLSKFEGIRPYYNLKDENVCLNSKGYRLPTEAEWEYACRGGTQTKYFFGDDPKQLGDYAWFCENSENRIHPVGLKKSNPFGLHDMIGNVWEWCSDYYLHKNSYQDYSEKWPKLSKDAVSIYTGKTKILRGGAFDMTARILRSSNRDICGKKVRHLGNSFRIVKNI